jgi:hypothetical protein
MWTTVDITAIYVGILIIRPKEERWVAAMSGSLHILTHTSGGVSHSGKQGNKGSDLHFYPFSTVFACGYYYYLYIYKTRFQADRFHIRFQPLHTYMDPRATA